jgi:hypothetical protein
MFTHASQGRLNWAIQTLNTIIYNPCSGSQKENDKTATNIKEIQGPRRRGASIDPKGKAMVKLVVPR